MHDGFLLVCSHLLLPLFFIFFLVLTVILYIQQEVLPVLPVSINLSLICCTADQLFATWMYICTHLCLPLGSLACSHIYVTWL